MKIRLSDIPEDGRAYSITRESGELGDALDDLIPNAQFRVELEIKPAGNAYLLEGKVQSSFQELCSLCGWDLSIPLNRSIKEVLIEAPPEDRETHYVHDHHTKMDEDLSTATYKNGVFDLAEYIHEVVAISEPSYPACEDPDCEHLAEANQKKEELRRQFEQAEAKTSPFAGLKDLKISKQ